ncbi:MAG: hypothetical protein JSV91_12170 [Phycisphaerales bacterium]|nr:MAG: hypothetical protein JSV91_12170 [Phycisphaerales bacterium]
MPRRIRFGPSPVILIFWYGVAVIFAVGIFIGLQVRIMPVWATTILVFLALAAVLTGIPLALAHLELNDEGIRHRTFRTWRVFWSDIEAWSRHPSTICFRTRAGRVRSLHDWLAAGRRLNVIAGEFEKRVGPPATGDDAVVPEFISSLASTVVETKDK